MIKNIFVILRALREIYVWRKIEALKLALYYILLRHRFVHRTLKECRFFTQFLFAPFICEPDISTFNYMASNTISISTFALYLESKYSMLLWTVHRNEYSKYQSHMSLTHHCQHNTFIIQINNKHVEEYKIVWSSHFANYLSWKLPTSQNWHKSCYFVFKGSFGVLFSLLNLLL